jgi:hypothetical protein
MLTFLMPKLIYDGLANLKNKLLSLLASGMSVNAVIREKGVRGKSLSSWILLASEHVNELSTYMKQLMLLGQAQGDEF